MKDMDKEMQDWVSRHASDDPLRLRLKYRGDDAIAQAIMQIECRRKAASRIPLALQCDSFLFPTSLSAEQTTSEALASIHADIAGYTPGKRHLDMTCGLGIDAFEAARRGAMVTAIDIAPEVAVAAVHNAEALGLESRFAALNADSSVYIATTAESWDSIFIDPARRSDSGGRLTRISDCRPDVGSLLSRMLDLAPKIIIKASPMLDMTALAEELNQAAGKKGCVTRIIAVGTARECKEIVAVVEAGVERYATVEAITYDASQSRRIDFKVNGNAAPPSRHNLPIEGDLLYEPYPAVMKTMAWGAIASIDPSLAQLNPNTHLFTSGTAIDTFPGIMMTIERVASMGGKTLKNIAKEYPKINVATRNFPIQAPELAKRLKIKEGGALKLYGARCGDKSTPAIIVARPHKTSILG